MKNATSKPTFGSVYGDPSRPSFITTEGIPVWMWRKGQKVRFLTATGLQIGPEHRNVVPAMVSAFAAGWQDTNMSQLANLACQSEVLSKSRQTRQSFAVNRIAA